MVQENRVKLLDFFFLESVKLELVFLDQSESLVFLVIICLDVVQQILQLRLFVLLLTFHFLVIIFVFILLKYSHNLET